MTCNRRMQKHLCGLVSFSRLHLYQDVDRSILFLCRLAWHRSSAKNEVWKNESPLVLLQEQKCTCKEQKWSAKCLQLMTSGRLMVLLWPKSDWYSQSIPKSCLSVLFGPDSPLPSHRLGMVEKNNLCSSYIILIYMFFNLVARSERR